MQVNEFQRPVCVSGAGIQTWYTYYTIESGNILEYVEIFHKVDMYMIIHYSDIIMRAMASQIAIITIVYSTVYSGADQRKNQSSASLAFVSEIHRWPVNSPHKVLVTRKMFPFDDVIMYPEIIIRITISRNSHTSTDWLNTWQHVNRVHNPPHTYTRVCRTRGQRLRYWHFDFSHNYGSIHECWIPYSSR